MKPKLSVVIITFNSERYLRQSLASASFAEEILVLDSGSTDTTIDIAKDFGASIYQEKWRGFGKQKQMAVDLARNDWIFVLDSDEIITSELREELLRVLKNPKFKGYLVPRLNYFFGRPLKRCGLYPDYSLRLFNRKFGKFTEDKVHERVKIEGKIGKLKKYMLHFAYENLEEFIMKQNKYSTLLAKPNRFKAIFSPLWTFFKLYFLKLGFLDGWEGFVVSSLYSQYTFWKYTKGSLDEKNSDS